VVLMDVRMPGTDGLEATRRILDSDEDPVLDGGQVKVLILTTFDLDDYVFQALRAGASGFLLKDASAQQLAEAVRVVAAGEGLLSPRITRRLIAEFASPAVAMPGPHRRPAELTDRETEVLTLLAQGRSNAEIAMELVVTEHTVKTHVARLLTKLGLRDRAQAIVYAYETGVVRPGG
jgi:DNA-binding NarL/FixJ family response regulator